MRMYVKWSLVSIVLSLVGCAIFHRPTTLSGTSYVEYLSMSAKPITNSTEAINLFPQSEKDIAILVGYAKKAAIERIDALCAVTDDERTFDNTVRDFDRAKGYFSAVKGMFEMYALGSPDALRPHVQKAFVDLKNAEVDIFERPFLYKVFNGCKNQRDFFDGTSEADQYFFDEVMRAFVKQGLALPDDQRLKAQAIRKELNELETQFSANIVARPQRIIVSLDALLGVPQDVINALEKTVDGTYVVGCDGPTYLVVMRYCSVVETRKKLFKAYNNRGYPENEVVLQRIVTLRDQYAKILGFTDYAAYDLYGLSAHDASGVEDFLQGLIQKAYVKVDDELALLAKDLPACVIRRDDGSINPWDYAYLTTYYKEKYLRVDEKLIAEYFPVDSTLKGLLEIYQKFFGLVFTEVSNEGVWHSAIRVLKVERSANKKLLGHILLDLYPRPGKNMHAYCGCIFPAYKRTERGSVQEEVPGVAMVSANFPLARGDKPALFTYQDVSTFFHEFGHAMHALLGSTPYMTMNINGVKMDFVEMPSQMFEEWLYQPEILQNLSSHYKTGELLPVDLIERKIALRSFGAADFVLGQSLLSLFALRLHRDVQDPSHLNAALRKQLTPHIAHDPDSHFYTSFEHLTVYAATYYVYLWSRVFAQDVFDYMRQQGLEKQAVGDRFAKMIFEPGALIDPLVMLERFLGRVPNQDAFLRSYGL